MSLIECRNCDETDCTGCNLHRLAFALRRGLFDACKDDHNAVCITSEVVPVVRCKECYLGRPIKFMDGRDMIACEFDGGITRFPNFYCKAGDRKDGADHATD